MASPMTISDALKEYLYSSCDYELDNPRLDLHILFGDEDIKLIETSVIDWARDIRHIDDGIVINFTNDNKSYRFQLIVINYAQSVGDYGNYEVSCELILL